VAEEFGITVRAARHNVNAIAKRLNWPHETGTKWKLTEEQYQRILAMKKK
jgi:hypothetical protein